MGQPMFVPFRVLSLPQYLFHVASAFAGKGMKWDTHRLLYFVLRFCRERREMGPPMFVPFHPLPPHLLEYCVPFRPLPLPLPREA